MSRLLSLSLCLFFFLFFCIHGHTGAVTGQPSSSSSNNISSNNINNNNTDENLILYINSHKDKCSSSSSSSSHDHRRHNLVLWRLQKVGSSSLLSILMSFSYRHDLLPKRRTNNNAFCRLLALTALAVADTYRDRDTQQTSQSTRYGRKERGRDLVHWMMNRMQLGDSRSLADMRDHVRHLCRQETHQRSNASCSSEQLFEWSDNQRRQIVQYVTQKVPGLSVIKRDDENNPLITSDLMDSEFYSWKQPYGFVLSHEMCNLNASLITSILPFAFPRRKNVENSSLCFNHATTPIRTLGYIPVDELFLVRNPLSRAISAYYFWGEIFKMTQLESQHEMAGDHTPSTFARGIRKIRQGPSNHRIRASSNTQQIQRSLTEHVLSLGGSPKNGPVTGSMFLYHGDESSVPPLDIAVKYAQSFPFTAGMPGPSFSWSAFANNYNDTLERIKSDGLMTLVLERLDESLVVMSHYLQWSLADIVLTKHRKALSKHPDHSKWPQAAIDILRRELTLHHEYELYESANRKLDQRILSLRSQGFDVDKEVKILRALRQKVTKICLDDNKYLDNYRSSMLNSEIPTSPSNNKLREFEAKFADNGHIFLFKDEILGSFDICGSCEAHALLLGVETGIANSIEASTTLFQLDYEKYRRHNSNFRNCPVTANSGFQ